MPKQTIYDIPVSGKRVLVRVDFNVPLTTSGQVSDDTRIEQALPTLRYLIENKAKVILLFHLGRPKGQVIESLRVDPVATRLSELLGQPVAKANDCIGPEVERLVADLQPGQILVLENTRFHAAETQNDPEFVKSLAGLGDYFVQDAFGVLHRQHASVTGIAQHLPAVAGLLVKKEIEELSQLFRNPKKPLLLITGGAKIDTKIGVLTQFLPLADTIVLGGGIANTFLAAQGYEIGESLYEPDRLELAREILLTAKQKNCEIVLPRDVITADAIEPLSHSTPTLDFHADAVPFNQKIYDIGIESRAALRERIATAGTIVWNGPVGLFEFKPFELGTRVVAEACAESEAVTLLGGGDTIKALKLFEIPFDRFTHVSTGGGAMLEFLEGKQLPGLEVLLKK